jgi:hypothetical protein
MSCTRRSENRFTGLFDSAAMRDVDVVNDGVWHSAHPADWKSAWPLVIDAAPPGVVADGTGGARSRMKTANFSIELIDVTGSVVSLSVMLLGTAENWHAVSSRSVMNRSFVIPISTL